MKTGSIKTSSCKRAFTLVEVLAALAVGTMILIVVMALYNRGQSGSAAVINRLESDRVPRELFQRIAEDLDRVVGADQGTQIDIQNKFQDNYSGKVGNTQEYRRHQGPAAGA